MERPGHNIQVIIWKDGAPKLDRVPVNIGDEQEGIERMKAMAEETAKQQGLEVSTALYQGDRYIASHRVLAPASGQAA